MAEVGTAEVYFAKKLANNDKKIRDKSLRRLRLWMSSKAKFGIGLEESEMLKLWKGLFYCMWFSDKPFVQEELADNLANILFIFTPPSSLGVRFAKVFFVTMGREWIGIDRLRVDKFYMLLKKYIRATYQYLNNSEWNQLLMDETSTFLKDLFTSEMYPDGLKTLFAEYALPELLKTCEQGKKLPGQSVILSILDPYFTAFAYSRSQSVRRAVYDEVIKELTNLCLSKEEDGKRLTVNMPFALIADRLFELASKKIVSTHARKKLFLLSKKYRELASDLQAENVGAKEVKRKSDDVIQMEEQTKNITEIQITKSKKKKKKKKNHEIVEVYDIAVIGDIEMSSCEADNTGKNSSDINCIEGGNEREVSKKKRKTVESKANNANGVDGAMESLTCDISLGEKVKGKESLNADLGTIEFNSNKELVIVNNDDHLVDGPVNFSDLEPAVIDISEINKTTIVDLNDSNNKNYLETCESNYDVDKPDTIDLTDFDVDDVKSQVTEFPDTAKNITTESIGDAAEDSVIKSCREKNMDEEDIMFQVEKADENHVIDLTLFNEDKESIDLNDTNLKEDAYNVASNRDKQTDHFLSSCIGKQIDDLEKESGKEDVELTAIGDTDEIILDSSEEEFTKMEILDYSDSNKNGIDKSYNNESNLGTKEADGIRIEIVENISTKETTSISKHIDDASNNMDSKCNYVDDADVIEKVNDWLIEDDNWMPIIEKEVSQNTTIDAATPILKTTTVTSKRILSKTKKRKSKTDTLKIKENCYTTEILHVNENGNENLHLPVNEINDCVENIISEKCDMEIKGKLKKKTKSNSIYRGKKKKKNIEEISETIKNESEFESSVSKEHDVNSCDTTEILHLNENEQLHIPVNESNDYVGNLISKKCNMEFEGKLKKEKKSNDMKMKLNFDFNQDGNNCNSHNSVKKTDISINAKPVEKEDIYSTPPTKKEAKKSEDDNPKPVFVNTPPPAAFFKRKVALRTKPLKKKKKRENKVLTTLQTESSEKKVRIELSNNVSVGHKEFAFSPMPAFSPSRKPVRSALKLSAKKRRSRAADFF